MATLYYAAVDHDCDGPRTAIVRFRNAEMPERDPRGLFDEHMPLDLWMKRFDGSNYHSHDEWFLVSANDVRRMMPENPPGWSVWSKYDYMSFNGDGFRVLR